MSERQRLEKEFAIQQQRWEELGKTIASLQRERDLEPRTLDRQRLEEQIAEREQDREFINVNLYKLENELAALKKNELILDARERERKEAYTEALQLWKQVREFDPTDQESEQEIQRITQKQQQTNRLADFSRRLTRRISEIKSVHRQVVQRLNELKEGNFWETALLTLVEDFLGNSLSANNFIDAWQSFEETAKATTPLEPPAMIDFSALARRIKRGQIVLFLGSDIPRFFDPLVPDAAAVVAGLAKKAKYEEFTGPLSLIAEYYRMRNEYGLSSLVSNLQTLLPSPPLEVPLYNLLAQVAQPLVLISASYDGLLEHAFQRTKKKYVVISSLVGASLDTDVGNVLLVYSDGTEPKLLRLEQEMSQFNLLADGYSLIYKIRGSLTPVAQHDDQQYEPLPLSKEQEEALTLSEEDYFTFARYMDRLIPASIVNALRGRGLLFLGYAPRQWEDRLIANALLHKRRYHEPPYTVGVEIDRFIDTYWRQRKVERYPLSLPEFVRELEAHFP